MGECKLATLQHLFEPPRPSRCLMMSPSYPPHCLMLQAERGGVYMYSFRSAVYTAERGPLCGPLQISRSKRGKHAYINKRSLLRAQQMAPATHLGFNHRSARREDLGFY